MRITPETDISFAAPKKAEISSYHHALWPLEVGYFDPAKRMYVQGFTDAVISWFPEHSWYVYHTKDSRGSKHGFPDLCFVHAPSGLTGFAELKTEKGVIRKEQAEWLWALSKKNKRVYLWKPSDEPEILGLVQRVEDWWLRHHT